MRCQPPLRLERPEQERNFRGVAPWFLHFRGANVGSLQREGSRLLGRHFRLSETVPEIGGDYGKKQVRVRAGLRG